MKTKILVLLVAIAITLSFAASRGPSLVTIITQYPTVYVGNAAGCKLNYDLYWRVTDPGGAPVLETTSQTEAALALLVCD